METCFLIWRFANKECEKKNIINCYKSRSVHTRCCVCSRRKFARTLYRMWILFSAVVLPNLSKWQNHEWIDRDVERAGCRYGHRPGGWRAGALTNRQACSPRSRCARERSEWADGRLSRKVLLLADGRRWPSDQKARSNVVDWRRWSQINCWFIAEKTN